MSTYFKPLRRKVGVVTLVLACLFAVGWVRSIKSLDIIIVYLGKHTTVTAFAEQQLTGLQYHSPTVMENRRMLPQWNRFSEARAMDRLFTDNRLTWHWRFCGFCSAEHQDKRRAGGVLKIWLFPYWSIVIPLTALSAWLLLSKPRARQHKPVAET